MAIRQILMMTGAASVLALASGHACAAEANAKATDNSGGTTIGELVVTAEKREQNLQTVPVAISAYTAAKRQLMGIDSIQDMTNFTPGLEYNSSTDRISLRGVGRLTNVLSADASVANYSVKYSRLKTEQLRHPRNTPAKIDIGGGPAALTA